MIIIVYIKLNIEVFLFYAPRHCYTPKDYLECCVSENPGLTAVAGKVTDNSTIIDRSGVGYVRFGLTSIRYLIDTLRMG